MSWLDLPFMVFSSLALHRNDVDQHLALAKYISLRVL
jgi:hypothetical protein